MEIVGNVNITGAYNINNRNVIADTSNYIMATSNALVSRIIASGGSGGALTSGGNLTLSNNATSNTVLSIANSNVVYGTIQGTSNYTSNYTSNVVTTISFIATFADANVPSTHAAVTSSTDRYMIFTTTGVNHTFTVPTGGLNCDILMIGGGGSDQGGYCGGGAGACIVAINHTLPAGSCIVRVGIGGLINTNGEDSTIKVDNTDRYRAKGGGCVFQSYSVAGTPGGCGSGGGYNTDNIVRSGGAAVSTNVVNGVIENTPPRITSTYAVLGNAGGNNGNIGIPNTGGGGGIGGIGADAGKGGDGRYDVAINGTTYNFRNYFANGSTTFGVQDGSTGNYYIGGGGGGHNGSDSSPNGLGWGSPNTGFGGKSCTGGTGIVIIRYRSVTTTTTPTPLSIPASTPITIPTTTFGVPTIELIRGISGDTNTDYKLGNYDGNFKIMSSISSIDTDRLSIINAGNIGIGTIPVSDTNKLQVQGNVNVSGGYFVAGTAFKPATAVLADTATALATSRTIAGVSFTGAANIDIPYFNLTNKITAGNGISLTTGSAVASPSISTNLTAGNGITISAAASPVIASSQWITTGANIYYNSGNVGIGTATVSYPLHVQGNVFTSGNIMFSDTSSSAIAWGANEALGRASGAGFYSDSAAAGDLVLRSATSKRLLLQSGPNAAHMVITSTGNVGIGTATIQSSYKLQVQGNAWVENQLVFNNSYRGGGGTDYACNKIAFYGGANAPTTNPSFGFGMAQDGLEYFSGGAHAFYTGTTGGTGYGTERMRITSAGNVIYGNDAWHSTTDNKNRLYYAINGCNFFQSGTTTNSANRNFEFRNTSLFLMGYFESNQLFYCYGPNNLSDRRIKRDIEDINDDDALNKILLIQPTTYYYRDESRNRGNGKVYGFIAQQIKEVIPDAVSITRDIIANIYKICLISNKRNVYHSIPLDVPIDTEIKILDKENGKGAIYKIKEIYKDYFVIDNDIDTDEAFVYGYSVNDLNGLDKSYIFTLNVCATQELHRRIEAQSVLIKSQDDRIKDLETKVAMLLNNTR